MISVGHVVAQLFEIFYSVETDSCPNFVVPSAEVRAAEHGDGLQSVVYAGCLSH